MAALCLYGHRLVMVFLDRQAVVRDGDSPREVYRSVDDINRMVDAVDEDDLAEISRVQDMLKGRLAQIQRELLIERISVLRAREA